VHEKEIAMQEETSTKDLNERLALIESMMREGRRRTESWGWTFLLWGIAYYVAIAWALLGRSNLAWPVTMIAATVVTVVLVSMKAGKRPETTMGRAIGSVWIALGISMFLVFFSLGSSGRLTDWHVFIAIACGMLGMANGTSALILRWKMQFACAVVWWAAAVASCFGSDKQAGIAGFAAIFFCQIVFGIYGMIAEARVRNVRGTSHA
jgi:hypothetical protein